MANGGAATAMANATVEERLLALEAGIDSVWVLSCGILVLLMQLGFALLECGCVREGNVVTTYAKNLFDLLVGVLCAILFGHGLANDLALDHILSAPVLTVDDGLSFFLFVAYQSTSATPSSRVLWLGGAVWAVTSPSRSSWWAPCTRWSFALHGRSYSQSVASSTLPAAASCT